MGGFFEIEYIAIDKHQKSFSLDYKTTPWKRQGRKKKLGAGGWGISHPGHCLRQHLYQRGVGKVWIAMRMVTMMMMIMRMGWHDDDDHENGVAADQ